MDMPPRQVNTVTHNVDGVDGMPQSSALTTPATTVSGGGGGGATNSKQLMHRGSSSSSANGGAAAVSSAATLLQHYSDDSDNDTVYTVTVPTMTAAHRAAQSLTLTELLGLFAMSFSYAFCFNTLNTIVIPKEIERLTSSRQSMWVGLVMATGAISQLATPIVGAWSDRAGQRTPYLVYGTFISILGIVGFLLAENFREIGFLMISHVTTTVGLSVQYSMVTALLNDYVPEEHTGKGSGAMAILAIFGSGAGYLLFAFNTPLTYSYCAYILASVICLGICVIHIPVNNATMSNAVLLASSPSSATTVPPSTMAITGGSSQNASTDNNNGKGHEELTTLVVSSGGTGPVSPTNEKKRRAQLSVSATSMGWVDSILTPLSMPSPSRYPDFFFACAGRALFNSGLAGQVYLVYYLRDIIGASNPVQITSVVAVMALLGGVMGALPSGVISDRVGKKPVIYGSITLCVATLLCFMVVRDLTTLHVVGFMYGVGNVAYLSVDYALGVQALPKRRGTPIDPAKDLGVFAMSATVGQLFGQVVYGAILDQYGTMTATGTQYNLWGFIMVYAMGGLCFVLSGVSTSYIRGVR